jgi:hypothetical protein
MRAGFLDGNLFAFWILRENHGRKEELCGLLYGGDGKRTLCGFAETIFDELKQRFGVHLTL